MFGFLVRISPPLSFQSMQDLNTNFVLTFQTTASSGSLALGQTASLSALRSLPHLNLQPLQLSPSTHLQTAYDTPSHTSIDSHMERVIGSPEIGRFPLPPPIREDVRFSGTPFLSTLISVHAGPQYYLHPNVSARRELRILCIRPNSLLFRSPPHLNLKPLQPSHSKRFRTA